MNCEKSFTAVVCEINQVLSQSVLPFRSDRKGDRWLEVTRVVGTRNQIAAATLSDAEIHDAGRLEGSGDGTRNPRGRSRENDSSTRRPPQHDPGWRSVL